jgi:chromosome transmission fidelity protein 1
VSRPDKRHDCTLRDFSAPEWVISQTRDRLRRELEADELEYEERLSAARKREETQRRIFARSIKRQVCSFLASCTIAPNFLQKPSPDESASDEEDSFLPDDDGDGIDDNTGHEPW